jgi:DMSO/TMAO reductase YedYZ molybdopterin-dependent catalytic subunit
VTVKMDDTRKNRITSRRTLLQQTLVSGSVLISGIHNLRGLYPARSSDSDSFQGGTQLGVVEFSDEGTAPMGQVVGDELDGRLFTDLSKLTPEALTTPSNEFYIRTRASKLLETSKPWSIGVGGMIEKPVVLWARDLEKMARPMGLHVLECSGNSRSVHFGMLSLAEWEGVPLQDIFENPELKPARDSRVLISGFDRYVAESRSSIPGASWIFTTSQLRSCGAFLATKMNAQPLTKDHGAPVRLLVPGWYGCACIKWVNEITFVAEDAPATSQMREYAGRTAQVGVPQLGRDYRPATIDFAAMPIRIEKWLVDSQIKYRVVGIQWGETSPHEGLGIRFNPGVDFVPVEDFQNSSGDSWNFWSHAWTPQKPGRYLIRLRRKGVNSAASRLDSGYYDRSVEIK